MANITPPSASQHAQQGDIYRQMGAREQVKEPAKILQLAIDEFEQALRNFDSSTTEEAKAWVYAHRGATYFQRGLLDRTNDIDFDEALQDFNTAITHKSDYAWAYAQKGETYRWQGIHHFLDSPRSYFDKGVEAFNQAIKQDPNYAWAYAHRGSTYRLMLEKPLIKSALADLNKAIELNKDYVWAFAYRSVVHRMNKNFDEAYDDLSQAVKIYPEMFVTYPGFNWPVSRTLTFTPAQVSNAQQKIRQPASSNDPYALYIIALDKALREGFANAKAEIGKARQAGIA